MKYNLVFLLFIYCFSSKANTGDTIRKSNVLEILSKTLQFESVSGKEKPLGTYLLNECEQMGFSTKVFSDYDSSYNFCASLYPLHLNKPNIILLNHLDVVPVVTPNDWKYSPYSGAIIHDTIWGRGCLDMKGIAVMQMQALQSFLYASKKSDFPYNITILFVSGEETGGKYGAKVVLDNFVKDLHPVLVIGEGGAGLKGVLPSKPEKQLFLITVAEKKSLWLKLSIEQKTNGHSSLPSKNTANRKLMKAISKIENEKPIIIFDKTTKRLFHDLGKMNGGFKGFLLKNINSIVLRPFRRKILNQDETLLNEVTSTIQLTSYNNPLAAPNMIPGTASAILDCRLLPGISSKKFIRKLKLRIHNPKIDIQIIDESPEAETSHPDEFFKAIESGLNKTYKEINVLPVLFPATTDNSHFRAAGIKTYGILPMLLNQTLIESIHGTDECVPLETFNKGIDAYKSIIEELQKVKQLVHE